MNESDRAAVGVGEGRRRLAIVGGVDEDGYRQSTRSSRTMTGGG